MNCPIFNKKSFLFKVGAHRIEFINVFALTVEEHKQTFAMVMHCSIQIFAIPIAVLVLGYIFFYTEWWILTPLYLAWIYYYDRHTPFIGGRKLIWFGKLCKFNYFKDYFPVNLIKTAELPLGKNYLLVCYPHGVSATGILSSLATEEYKVKDKVFPGFDIRAIASSYFFNVPFLREYALSIGYCAATEDSIRNLLESQPTKGIVLVAGGPSELPLAYPGSTYNIISSRRKGFVRISLKTGASLVPVFSFGQNNIYDIGEVKSKWISQILKKFRQFTGITLVKINGRGLIQNSFGWFPRRSVINVVVGKPIALPKVENPSEALIEEYHGKFFQALQTLFEEYKHKYDVAGADAKLIML